MRFLQSTAILWAAFLVGFLVTPRVLVNLPFSSDWFLVWYGVVLWSVHVLLFAIAVAFAVSRFLRAPKWLWVAATFLSMLISAGAVALTLFAISASVVVERAGWWTSMYYQTGFPGLVVGALFTLVLALEAAGVVAGVSRLLAVARRQSSAEPCARLTHPADGAAQKAWGQQRRLPPRKS